MVRFKITVIVYKILAIYNKPEVLFSMSSLRNGKYLKNGILSILLLVFLNCAAVQKVIPERSLFDLGREHENNHQYEKAISNYRLFIQQNPKNNI